MSSIQQVSPCELNNGWRLCERAARLGGGCHLGRTTGPLASRRLDGHLSAAGWPFTARFRPAQSAAAGGCVLVARCAGRGVGLCDGGGVGGQIGALAGGDRHRVAAQAFVRFAHVVARSGSGRHGTRSKPRERSCEVAHDCQPRYQPSERRRNPRIGVGIVGREFIGLRDRALVLVCLAGLAGCSGLSLRQYRRCAVGLSWTLGVGR